MDWSQIKKRTESNFADSVKGRIEIWATRYRKAHDATGEVWITIDGERVWSMAECSKDMAEWKEARRIQTEQNCTDHSGPAQEEGYDRAYIEAKAKIYSEGIFDFWEVKPALLEYMKMPIDEILESEDAIIQAIGMLDRRLGKRRLRAITAQGMNPLVKFLYEFRCEAEGIKPNSTEALKQEPS